MFVVTLFSAVSAVSSNWGGLDKKHCKSMEGTNDEIKDCLNGIGERWAISAIVGRGKWGSKTCEEHLKGQSYCSNGTTYVLEATTCCGDSCWGADDAGECSLVGGLSADYVAKIEETECTAEDTTSCSELSETLKTLLPKRTVELVCENNKCAPKAAAKPDDKKPDGEKPDGKKPDGKKPDGTKPAEGNAFAMGLSTLAGALVILQL